MRKTVLTTLSLAALALVISSSSAQAQGARGRAGAGADVAARRAWMQEHRADLKAKWESLTPEQRDAYKAHLTAYRDERKSLMEQVKAGTLDKKTAATQLKAWREANKPTTP